MYSTYIEQQHALLEKKFNRLVEQDVFQFHAALVRFWGYLSAHPLHSGVLAVLEREAPFYSNEILRLVTVSEYEPREREVEVIHFSFRVLQFCLGKPIDSTRMWEVMIGSAIAHESDGRKNLNAFIKNFLLPFYDALEESLLVQRTVLSMLVRYKRQVEWFERREVAARVANGERELATHLYAYLFSQGLDFHIEPQSISGEADLVASDLVLDAKIFDGRGGRGKSYIRSGLNQVHTYTLDFNQSVGYLAIYRTCPEDLQFDVGAEGALIPFVTLGSKTIYLLVIDVCDYQGVSASKRGPLSAHVLTAEDLRSCIQEVDQPPASE